MRPAALPVKARAARQPALGLVYEVALRLGILLEGVVARLVRTIRHHTPRTFWIPRATPMVTPLIALMLVLPFPGHAEPHRIVSLNLCTDYLLWRLADRTQIASLSYLAADPTESLIAADIKGVPLNYGRAEEIRLMNPDLVLAGTYGARFAVELLKSRGFNVVEIAPANGLADIAPEIETVGKAIGQEARAGEMVRRFRARLAALQASIPPSKVTAIVFQPRGFAAGAPSLASDVLGLAGARNLAAEAGFKSWAPIGVEGLLELDPDLVVIDSPPDAPPSISSGVLRHRALRYFSQHHRILQLDGNLWSCGVPETLDAVDEIRSALARDKVTSW